MLQRAEKIWLALGIATLIVFLGILAASALTEGMIPPSHAQTIDPEKVAETPPFDKPGLRKTATGTYEAYLIAHIFSFTPSHITVPKGSKITFYATSPDVVHGFFIANTAVNMLVVPGWVSAASHTFKEPGTYLLLCNEYCGSGHHFMYGEIEVR